MFCFTGWRPVWSEPGCDELHKRQERDTQSSGKSSALLCVGFLWGRMFLYASSKLFVTSKTVSTSSFWVSWLSRGFVFALRAAARWGCWTLRPSPLLCGTFCPSCRKSSGAWQEPTCKRKRWLRQKFLSRDFVNTWYYILSADLFYWKAFYVKTETHLEFISGRNPHTWLISGNRTLCTGLVKSQM